ncbi:molybdopterin-synthase adenylyltransferase MoeB [Candidatus Neomarinimicrobiota bacterium]
MAASSNSTIIPTELSRYARHLALDEVGLKGQQQLKSSSVLIVGAGGLGSPATLYLSAAGVGRIGIADYDMVAITNLQRQVLHGTDSLGTAKTESAQARIANLNPHTNVETWGELTGQNALEIIGKYDVVVDGSDNFPTRYLLNDACRLTGTPLIYGTVYRFEGQVTVFNEGGPCYRCLFPEPPPAEAVPSCSTGGVLGVVPGIIGTLQATEALKYILKIGENLVGRLVLVDTLTLRFDEISVQRNRSCPLCGDEPTITSLIDYEDFCGTRHAPVVPTITAAELAAIIDEVILIDVRENWERAIAVIDTAINIPEGELPNQIKLLPTGKPLILYCRSGVRSARSTDLLLSSGFDDVRNLTGGILAWADEIDQGMAKY